MRLTLNQIAAAIDADRFRITDHADEEMNADGLVLSEVIDSVRNGEIIEQYPTDRPFPSCLVHGRTQGHVPVHSVWAYHEGNGWAVLITVYRPDPERWIDFRIRRPPS